MKAILMTQTLSLMNDFHSVSSELEAWICAIQFTLVGVVFCLFILVITETKSEKQISIKDAEIVRLKDEVERLRNLIPETKGQ